MQEKSENFNSLRLLLFELCKKKLPPPAGIGLIKIKFFATVRTSKLWYRKPTLQMYVTKQKNVISNLLITYSDKADPESKSRLHMQEFSGWHRPKGDFRGMASRSRIFHECLLDGLLAAAPGPQPVLAAALGPLARPSRSARPRNCLSLT